MKKKRNFSDEELMQAMGLDLPSSKSGTEAHGETVPETMALIFDEPESMKQPEPAHPEGTPGGRVTAFRPMPVTAVFIGNHQSYQPMMAKIVKGAGAKGIVDYILDREKETSLIDHDGVLVSDNGSIARNFIAQSRLNPKLEKFIGHISLSVSRRDLPRLIDELMVHRKYMMKMGIRDTQYIIGRHHDKEHPHVHIAFNGSKIDRQFGYSKITAALNWNGLEERQAQSYQQCISLVSSGGEEFISGSLRLLDLTPSSCAETPEEAKFYRLMQQKNKGF